MDVTLLREKAPIFIFCRSLLQEKKKNCERTDEADMLLNIQFGLYHLFHFPSLLLLV